MSNVIVRKPPFHEPRELDFFKLLRACDSRALKEQQGSVFPQCRRSKKVLSYTFTGTAREAIKNDKLVWDK